MADFETGDIVRLGCVQKLDTLHDIVNVLHLKIVSGGGLAFAAAALDFQQYGDELYATLVTKTSDNVLADHISVANITQSTVWGSIAFNLYAGGANAADPVAAQLALLVWGRTSISRVQIRKYLGVFTEGDIEAGVWTAGMRSVAQNYIDYHIVEKTMDEGLILQGVAYNALLSRATVAVTGTTSAIPVVQRRRRIGRGS